MCNMESKENTDEDVKKGKFLFFFAQKSQASTSSFSFSRPEKVVTLFFLFFFFFFFSFSQLYLASYISGQVSFFSSDKRRRWEILLGSFFVSHKKRRMMLLLLTHSYTDWTICFILLALFFYERPRARCRFSTRDKKKKVFFRHALQLT
jgi:hypothetical protein